MRNHSSVRKHLWETEISVFSQWGEDGIITFLLDSLEITKPRMIEVGAGMFNECNSRFQAEFRNASVYAIDPSSSLIPNCQSLDVFWRTTVIPINDFVTPLNINKHIESAKSLLGGIDIFSLDVDGNDYWILEAADLNEVSIVVCEYNPVFGNKATVTVPRNDKFNRELEHYSWLYYGMSLRACISVLSEKKFTFCGSNLAGNNAFFVRNNLIGLLPLEIPPLNDLSIYTDWRVRESRDQKRNLSYLFGKERERQIESLKVFDIKQETLIPLKYIL